MNPPPTDLRIAAVADESAPSCDLIRQWLREHNWSTNPAFMTLLQQPEQQALPVILLATLNEHAVGGLFADTQLAWLRISIMSVDPAWRSKGIGASLLAEAEREAINRGCKHAYVDTMEYQAPRFYMAHGFTVVGEIPDWDSHGHSKLFLSKRLQ